MKGFFCLLGMLVLLSCSQKVAVLDQQPAVVSDNYKQEIEEKRFDRLAKLKGPKGWLSVVALHWLAPGVNTIGGAADNSIVFPRIETETVGAYQLANDEVFFGKVEGVEVTADGQEYLGGPVSIGYPPTMAHHESLYWYVLKRGEKYGIRLLDTLADNRVNFPGLKYFDLDHDYRVNAMVRKPDTLETVAVTNILGNVTDYSVAAYLDFTVQGNQCSLMALDEGTENFFVIFGDLTNSVSSYGGGRFLYPKKVAYGKSTILDFNLAENPPCSFTDFATCPLPPLSNMLQVPIKSGERNFHF